MEIFFSYYLISFGLGQLASKSFSRQANYQSLGLDTFLGFSLIPILLFVLNLVCKIPLNISAYLIAFTSILGLGFFISKVKEFGFSFIKHPIFLFVIPTLIVFALASNGYYPYSWDEFSHWATMPKQIFLHNQITSDQFLIKNFAAYTPGWPIVVIFKDLIFSKSLQYGHFLFLPLFSSLLMLSVLYDAVVSSFKNSDNLGWIILLLAVFLHIPTAYFYETNLIEFPMIHGLCVLFTLCFLHFNSTTLKDEEVFIRIGIALAYCYLLKHTFMTMVPIVALFYLFFIFKKNNRFTKKNFLLLLYLIVPYLIVFSIWQWNLGAHDLVQGYSPVNNTLTSALEKAFSRLDILFSSLKSFFLLFVNGEVAQVAFMLLFPFVVIFSKKFRKTGILITTYLFFYYACLMWMYLTVFSIGEAKSLASFERFMSIPLATVTLFSFVVITLEIITKIPDRFKLFFLKHKIQLLCISVFILSAIFYRKIHRTQLVKNVISTESTSLIKLIKQNNLQQPKVLIIAQGGDRFEYHVANFESIGSSSYNFSVLFGTSWGEQIDNPWRILVTKKEMLSLLSQADILWVIKSDKWMDINLVALQFTNTCNKTYDNYFIRNNGNGTYTCHEKAL